MCGIYGFLNISGLPVERSIFDRMEKLLQHRGPDAKGVHIYGDHKIDCVLGQTRLSILDLSDNGSQPMFNEDNSLALVFNGEIYNYKKIRTGLLERGHILRSNSDTEVILHLYEEKKEALLEDLRGMFAFALYDRNKNEFFVARDRLGIKPLYYVFNKDYFLFASEIKALRGSGLVKEGLNYKALNNYLASGYIRAPMSINENIAALDTGCFMKVNNRELKITRYYNLADKLENRLENISEELAVNTARTELLESVKHHLVADVDVGVFLSGGIDSTGIVSLMRKVRHEKIKTISVIFPHTVYDESSNARLSSKKYNTDHYEVEIKGKDILEAMDNYFEHMDQPTIDGINTYFVSLAAKKAGLKVVLSGQGGDEVFGGYPSFAVIPKICRYLKLAKKFPVPGFLDWLPSKRIEKIKYMLDNNIRSFNEIYTVYRGIFNRQQIINKLEPGLAEKINKTENIILENNHETDKIKNDFTKISFLELNYYMAGQLLRDSDVFSMANSIELRVPFVDHKLIEALTTIPSIYMNKKKLLVKAVADLPAEITGMKKKGFTFPIDNWLRAELKPVVEAELFNSKIYNEAYIRKLMEAFYCGKLHYSRIWSLFVLSRFLKVKM